MGVAKANVGMSERGAWENVNVSNSSKALESESKQSWSGNLQTGKEVFFPKVGERERKKRRGSALLDLSYFALQPKWKLSGN